MINQIWQYQIFDLLVTLSQALLISTVVNSLCREPRKRMFRWILSVVWIVLAYFWTWVIVDATWKLTFLLITMLFVYRICYRDSSRNIIIACLMGLVFVGPAESATLLLLEPYVDPMTVIVGGMKFASPFVYLGVILVSVLLSAVLYFLFRRFHYQLNRRDFIVLLIFELILFVLLNSRVSRFLGGDFNEKTELVAVTLASAFVVVFLYLKNNNYLREQEQQDKMQIAQLQQQYAYYQDKRKDEERIRSIYHDMKNHLLVLENRENAEETRQMAEKLRSQIADYEDYVHTGNDFLDIIIKDKSERAREKQIDFSAAIDFGEAGFIDPLDISTIFGNAIDNAIEASEKLPEDRRMIEVKAGRVQDMVSIVIQNNYDGSRTPEDKRTSKADAFMHGFGISNIKKAAEKYGGACTFTGKDGQFVVKILLPIPPSDE